MKLKTILQILLLAGGLIGVTMTSLWQVQQVSLAQGPDPIEMTKTLNRASNVVRVGEVLSFTINLHNRSGFTLTHVTMVDDYDNTVLAFAGAVDPHDTHDPDAGTIIWDNIANPPILPNQRLTYTVFFTVEHPKPVVVNYVRSQDITATSGSLTYTAQTSQTGEAIGGAAPVIKSLYPPAGQPRVGFPITFTHLVTNDGAARLTRLPLTDTFEPSFLQFNFALPVMPDVVSQSSGLLVWYDLTDYFGDLPPFSSVVVTTVFTASAQVVNTVNSASTEGALDEYDNDLTGGMAQVPIIIIQDTPTATPTPTPTPTPTDDDEDSSPSAPDRNDEGEDEEDEDQPTVTPYPTLTPTPILATPANLTDTGVVTTPTEAGPAYLPETGRALGTKSVMGLLGLILLTLGVYVVKKFDQA